MIDVVNKKNASILIRGIDLPQQPITMWAEVTRSVTLLEEGSFVYPPVYYFVPTVPKSVKLLN